MRRISGTNRAGRRLAAALVGVSLLIPITGCGAIAYESSPDEVEEIPAALRDSDIGVTEAFAEKALNGFTFYLSVGVYLDHDELDDSELGSILQIIVDENDLPTDTVVLTVLDSSRGSIDLEPIADRLAPGAVIVSSSGDIRVTMDGAREIIDAVNAEQS